LLSVTQMLEKCYKVSFERKNCVFKDANNLKVFKVHMIDKKLICETILRLFTLLLVQFDTLINLVTMFLIENKSI